MVRITVINDENHITFLLMHWLVLETGLGSQKL